MRCNAKNDVTFLCCLSTLFKWSIKKVYDQWLKGFLVLLWKDKVSISADIPLAPIRSRSFSINTFLILCRFIFSVNKEEKTKIWMMRMTVDRKRKREMSFCLPFVFIYLSDSDQSIRSVLRYLRLLLALLFLLSSIRKKIKEDEKIVVSA